LCTYGFAGRALLSVLCDNDPSAFGSIEGRFSAPVFPGETLTTEVWTDESGGMFRTLGEDGRVVLGDGRCTRR
jgi:acyl dehydratase